MTEILKRTGNTTFFLQEDIKNAYAYVYGTKIYMKGYAAAATAWSLGYIESPADITAGVDPALGDHANSLTISLSEFIAWGIDRQFDRQKEIVQQIITKFGVKPDGV